MLHALLNDRQHRCSWQLRQHALELDYPFRDTSGFCVLGQVRQRCCLIQRELADCSARNLCEMRIRSMQLAQIVCERSYVRAGATFHHKASYRSLHAREPKLEYFHLDRLEIYRLVFSSQLMRRRSANFLGGKGRRRLLNISDKLRRKGSNLFRIKGRRRIRTE